MRVIYRASLVFLLKDVYSKHPVTNAVILCNGKQNPYTRKASGHYVFSNLYPGKYEISIVCKGYNSLNFSVELKENETKEIIYDLSYTPDNQNIMNLTRFELTCTRNKEVLSEMPIILKLTNELEFLKMLEPIKAESDELKTNLEMVPDLLGQKYIYEVADKSYEFFFWSYDNEKKCYILKDLVSEQIEPEGKFFAVWELRTDKKGRAIMPLMTQFMKGDKVNFDCRTEELIGKASFDVAGKQQSGEIFYADVNFK